MARRELERNYRIIASAGNVADFVDLLKGVRDNVNDVRTTIGVEKGVDSIDLRKSIAFVLTGVIDKISSGMKNADRRGRSHDTDDDSPPGDEAEGEDLL